MKIIEVLHGEEEDMLKKILKIIIIMQKKKIKPEIKMRKFLKKLQMRKLLEKNVQKIKIIKISLQQKKNLI